MSYLHPFPEGEEHPNAILTEELVIAMRRMRKAGYPYFHISDEFHVHVSTAYAAITGKSWTCVDAEEPVEVNQPKRERKVRQIATVKRYYWTEEGLVFEGTHDRYVEL